ncbi:MAG TPA: NrfD/PsrC family molybdoenzyme membrane anchor subunit [Thermodesulfobacteriota bacterium]
MAQTAARPGTARPEPFHPVLVGRPREGPITDQLLRHLWTRSRAWLVLLALSGGGVLLLLFAVSYTVAVGIGVWGNSIPVAWAFAITNFVWWIGIGHAGTFISAFLLLLQQSWRTSINRVAEAMTLFAVLNAALFPLIHLGRPWFFYWLAPYPATMGVWPNFKSALPWDAAAVGTYFTVSLLFWYTGLIPDLAAARDRVPGRLRRRLYGVFALGWQGSGRDWHHYRVAYGLLAGLATPLVVSVHNIVSLDFAITQLPGWHSTIFPPYFVVGAIYSGFAMVVTLLVPIRSLFGLQHVITARHLDNVAKLLLATGLIVAYSYLTEVFVAWYSGNPFEMYTFLVNFPRGPYAPMYWLMIVCNVLVPQLFWAGSLRTNAAVLFVASLLINVGMWTERFMIIVGSLSRDFLPSAWAVYRPTWVDLSILSGTLALFVFLFVLFLRFVPFVPISELKELTHELERKER